MPQTKLVQVTNMAYSPATIVISAGDTVRWTNQDPMVHTATADNGEFDSGDLSQGASFDQTFAGPPRDVTYYCQYHGGMHGKVSVT
jgi:plastocyanin